MASKKKAPPPQKAAAKKPKFVKLSRAERAAAAKEACIKKLGERGEITAASELSLPYITKRLPTGLLNLDLELRGGFPAAGISQVAGPKNSNKSWLYWQVIRQLQKMLGDKMWVLLAMTEMRADKTQARLAGVKIALSDEDIRSMERAQVQAGGQPFTPEELEDLKTQIGHIDEVHCEAVEDLYDVILRMVDQQVYQLIIIDSFGSVMSNAEAETESLREKTYGGAAGPTTQFLHKLTALFTQRIPGTLETRDTCIIGVNQIREDLKNPNNPWRSPGGKALEHAKFVDLNISSGRSLGADRKILGPAGIVQRHCMCSKSVGWDIKKGKAGIHEGARGEFEYIFHKHVKVVVDGVEREYQVEVNDANWGIDYLIAAEKCGLIRTTGNWHELVDLNGNQLLRANGRDNLARLLMEDQKARDEAGDPDSFMEQTRRNCYSVRNIKIDNTWEDE